MRNDEDHGVNSKLRIFLLGLMTAFVISGVAPRAEAAGRNGESNGQGIVAFGEALAVPAEVLPAGRSVFKLANGGLDAVMRNLTSSQSPVTVARLAGGEPGMPARLTHDAQSDYAGDTAECGDWETDEGVPVTGPESDLDEAPARGGDFLRLALSGMGILAACSALLLTARSSP